MAGEYVVTSYAVEALTDSSGPALVNGFVAETLHAGSPTAPVRVEAFVIEVLRAIAEPTVPSVRSRRIITIIN